MPLKDRGLPPAEDDRTPAAVGQHAPVPNPITSTSHFFRQLLAAIPDLSAYLAKTILAELPDAHKPRGTAAPDLLTLAPQSACPIKQGYCHCYVFGCLKDILAEPHFSRLEIGIFHRMHVVIEPANPVQFQRAEQRAKGLMHVVKAFIRPAYQAQAIPHVLPAVFSHIAPLIFFIALACEWPAHCTLPCGVCRAGFEGGEGPQCTRCSAFYHPTCSPGACRVCGFEFEKGTSTNDNGNDVIQCGSCFAPITHSSLFTCGKCNQMFDRQCGLKHVCHPALGDKELQDLFQEYKAPRSRSSSLSSA
jgi:hypothetical protein